MYNINMNSNISKLPKSFGVKADNSHPRWSECISIMNKEFNGYFNGFGWVYYGMTLDGDYNCWDIRSNFDIILSIDEFFAIIDSPAEITNYQIF